MENCVYVDEKTIPFSWLCQLCYRPLFDPVVLSLSCGQFFCRPCFLSSCSDHTVRCPICSAEVDPSSIPFQRASESLFACLDNLRVRCASCSMSDVIPRRSFLFHVEKECPKRQVCCSASDLRCSWQGLAEDLQGHRSVCALERVRPWFTRLLTLEEEMKRVLSLKERIDSLQRQSEEMERQSEALREETKINEEILGQVKEVAKAIVTESAAKEKELQTLRTNNEGQEKELKELRRRNEERMKLEEEVTRLREEVRRSEQRWEIMETEKREMNEERERFKEERDLLREKSLLVDSLGNELNQLRVKSNGEEILHGEVLLQMERLQARLSPLLSFSPEEKEEKGQKRNTSLEQFLVRCPRQSLINLNGETIGDDDQSMSILLQHGLRDRQCHSLRLFANSLSPQSLVRLANELNSNRTLETLLLSHNVLSLSSLESLCHPLSMNNFTLRQLTLAAAELDDRSMPSICAMLRTNQSLLTLGLHENRFSDRAVEFLAEVLQGENQTLEELSLHSHPLITDLSLPSLRSIFRFNQTLNTIDIQRCQISPNAKEQLQQTVQNSKTDFHLQL